MSKARLTYTKTFEVDLLDSDMRELISTELAANGVEGIASVADVTAAFKSILENDPDTLIPSLDDEFDASNFVITVEESVSQGDNVFNIIHPDDDGNGTEKEIK